MLINRLLLVLEVLDGKPTYGFGWETNIWEIMGWESSGVAIFDLVPLLQGQTRKAKPKIAYNSFIIGRRDLA